MRIQAEKLNLFKKLFSREYKDIKLFLFGSRVDKNKKGGDIDILILSNKKIDRSYIRFVKREFYKKFGDQKIDIVNFTYDEKSNFKELILLEAKEF